MRWGPTKNNASCPECWELAQQLNETFADVPGWPNAASPSASNDGTQTASDALRRLIGGTEEDAERADELLDTYKYQSLSYCLPQLPPLAVEAVRRSAQHAVRTGHWLMKIAG
jgi:hypothetical protein